MSDSRKTADNRDIRSENTDQHVEDMFTEGFMVDRPRNFKSGLVKLLKYMRPYWAGFVVVVIFAVAGSAFAVVGPKIMGGGTDIIVDGMVNGLAYDQILSQIPEGQTLPQGITGGDFLSSLPEEVLTEIPERYREGIRSIDLTGPRPTTDFAALGGILLLLIVLYVTSAALTYTEGFITANITQKVSYALRRDISRKINRLPLKFFDKHPFGDILSRVTNDVDTITTTLNQVIVPVISGTVTILIMLGIMISISWIMTLMILLILPLSGLLVSRIIKKSQKYFSGNQKSIGELNGHVEEMYGSHNVVKAFGGEKKSIAKFGRINDELCTNNWKSEFFSGLAMPIVNFINNVGYVAVCILGGYLAVRRMISIGDIQAFIQYVQQLTQPIAQMAQVFNMLQSGAAASERVFDFLSEEEETDSKGAAAFTGDLAGQVSFERVSFGYDPLKPVINDFNIEVSPGQRVAIVGATGAGKTTVVNLLMRFYDLSTGVIRIDGVDISTIRRSDLRGMMGMVLQDTWLFNGTIRQNLAYGKKTATEEEIFRAAAIANVDHYIRTLPDGYDTVLDEAAGNVSQGQKQLLTIARAVLANPGILILDEATSSVDTRTEVLIQKAMDNLMQGRTCFVIAHRLSTIRDADIILVMHEGSIAEQGTHEQLLSLGGRYAELYNSQFEETA